MNQERREKAIAWIKEEIRSLERAPELNGCPMTPEWAEQLDIMRTCLEAVQLSDFAGVSKQAEREYYAGFSSNTAHIDREELTAEYKARAEKAERERDELFNLLDDTCKDVRERHVDDSVCGLCEYDGVYISESGDFVNECPGFDIDDCFCMKKSIQEKYGQKEE